MRVNGKQGDSISIRDRGFLYGDGVFRTFLARHGQARHWHKHYQKIRHDSAVLGIVCPDFELLTAELQDLLDNHPDGVVKLIVTRGKGARGYAPPDNSEGTHVWDITPSPMLPAGRAENGIKLKLCQLLLSQQPRFAGVKHLNRLENVLAAAELIEPDVAEGLMMDANGYVIGGTRSNVFLVSQGDLVTPELSRCGVAGVQRDRVMAWAVANDMSLQVRDVTLDEVLNSDEVFIVNSLVGLWPVRELENCRWSGFTVATRIKLFLEQQDPN
jgi:4-amino-4-deoxychorismate lyase